MDKPRVSICIPSGETWKTGMGMSLAVMMYHLGHTGIVETLFNQQASDIALGRNGLVEQAMAANATHILWIDSDQTFPKETLETLLSHNKDVVGCFYSTRLPPYRIVGQLQDQEDWDKGGIAPAIQMPGGCVLVKTEVYKKIGGHPYYEEWFDPREETPSNKLAFVSDDTVFTRRAISAGCEVYCDIELSKRIGHVGSTTCFIEPGYKRPDTEQ